jgi:hypothetical protein
MAALRARKIILSYRRRGRARVHAVHSIGTTTSTKSAAPDPPRRQRPASCMDKDDEPKPVADYWINPAFKKRQPGPRDVIIPTGGRGIVIRTGGKPVARTTSRSDLDPDSPADSRARRGPPATP